MNKPKTDNTYRVMAIGLRNQFVKKGFIMSRALLAAEIHCDLMIESGIEIETYQKIKLWLDWLAVD